ncbi:hypothetical protein B9479_008090 [Cryptococcus floricola]|uniref:Integrase catalytic domain-containing protein n=1 Tax=Cryptococcus floricola TaxID=2591691 RepID=A0A5D3AMR1_9TREE|nr:hypothetical protein B9479_008090 [Cryptococcus floricola]
MDFAGPFPPSGPLKHNMILIVVDKLTKRSHFIPCFQTDNASHIANLFFDNIVRHHGLPQNIISDRHVKFTSTFWRALFARLGTELSISSSNHPQSDGQAERMVQTVKEMLRHFISRKSNNWYDLLPVIEFAYNSAPHAATGKSPFELDVGYQPRAVPPYPVDSTTNPAADQFLETLVQQLSASKDSLMRAQESQAEQYNRGRRAPQFDVGQDVLVSTSYIKPPFFREKGRPPKLKPKFTPHIKAHTSINISHLKPFVPDPFERTQPLPPPIDADDNIYEVERIVADRTVRGKTEYLISWKGFPDVYDTWEPASNITNKNIIDKYLSSEQRQAGVYYSEATDFPFVPIRHTYQPPPQSNHGWGSETLYPSSE